MKKVLELKQGVNIVQNESQSPIKEAKIGQPNGGTTATTSVKEKPKAFFSIFNKPGKMPLPQDPVIKMPSVSSSEMAVKDCENKPPMSSRFSLINYLKEPQWRAGLAVEFKKPYMKSIEEFLQKQYDMKIMVRPPRDEIFNAFNLTPLKDVKVVIIGQDPYHGNNQAHGLSFSVKKGVAIPKSLINIYRELADDIEGFQIPQHGNLLGWAAQGVFMLNAALSVELHKANSHSQIGWNTFTDKVIEFISKNVKHCVFLLWGASAQRKIELIDKKRHTVIMTTHPSPLSCHRGFLGSKCFSKANQALKAHGMEPIDWNRLP